MTPKRKLIEVALPLEAINRESAREKSIRHGHPSTLHLWWARRPLAACRAVLFAQLVDDPSAHPDRFPTDNDQEIERQRLFALIERLVVWENSTNTALLKAANDEIARSAGGPVPPVLDPFAGGGSIPLEAKRLGLEAYANDLNPLPVLINTVLLDLVDRFPLQQPTTGGMRGPAPASIAADVRYWGAELEALAAAKASHNYPKSAAGGEGLVFLWARTVNCPNPACGIEIPLVGSWRASARKGSETMLVPHASSDGKSIDVSVHVGKRSEPARTIDRRGGVCPLCDGGFPLEYVKAEGVAGRMGLRLLAVQERYRGKRSFRAATSSDRLAAGLRAPDMPWLDAELSTHSQYMAPPRYGLTTFKDLYLPRQAVMLEAFVEGVQSVAAAAAAAAAAGGLPDDDRPFAAGGKGPRAYGEAIWILLALGVGRLLNRASSLCIWDATRDNVQQVFARQAYSMTWFFAEANPFAGASGSFSGQIEYLAKAVEALPSGSGHVSSGPAQSVAIPSGAVVSTDPPYYDAVPYADLSDYFIVWLRHMLGGILPTVFGTVLAPKEDELVADHVRHGGKRPAASFFESGMSEVFRNIAEHHNREYPMTVYYAFKAVENVGEGQGSTGWETFLQSLVDTGWAISGTWPMRTEQAGGLRELGRNALASSVVVVCRLKAGDADVVNRRSFLGSLKAELPSALRTLQQGSIAPVDLAQAAVGPGMRVFSRYARVVEADGSDMKVRTALALINQVLDEVLTEQEGDFDADSRFCVKWFSQFGWNEGRSGEADVLAKATNTSIEGLVRGGVFRAVAGKARLIAPEELNNDWDPTTDDRVSDWEVVVRLAHAVRSEGVEATAAMMAAAGQRVDLDTAKELAYLLYAVCEKKGWTESALLFNGLAASWSDVASAARSHAGRPAGTQSMFDFDSEQ